MFDDGYNRKKSKKRKKKQNGDKEKKPKIEKPKKDASKFNVQSIVKLEVKNETHSDFEYLSQENNEEFLVPQGSYNDKIIIEEDPLKIIDNPLEMIEKVKKKKKHSKHSEQKKLKPKHVSKSKRKRDNLSFLNMSTSDMYDINVSKIQENINVIPGDYNLMPVSVSISNELNKKTTNKTNINQLTNRASNDNRKDMAKSSVSIAESRPAICSSTNDKNDFSKIAFTNTDFEKNSYAIAQDTNISCQNKTSRCLGVTPIKQFTNINYKSMDVMSPENRSITNIRKDIIKAPRLVLPNTSSIRIKPQTENQQTSIVSKIDTNNVMDAKNAQNIYFCLPSFHKPPVLKNETEAQCIGTNNMVKSPPPLEISMQIPTDTVAHVPNADCTPMFFNTSSQLFNRNTNFKSGMRTMGRTPSTSDGSEKCIKTTWPQNNSYSNSSKLVQEAAISEQDFIQISSLASISPIPKNTTIVPQCQTYLPPSFMSVNYIQNTDISPVMNVLPAPACNSKQTMPKVTKSTSRQRSQKGTSRRKPSAKSNKSSNNASSNTSQASITSTSVGTQINSPIDSTWNLSDSNIQSRITNIQSTLYEHTNISDNKAQLQDSQIQKDNICSPSLASKVKMPSISRKKPKEKKATTRRKQPMILSAPIIPVSNVPIVASGTVVPAVSATVTPSIVAPVDVVPAAVATIAVAPATIAPATITPAIIAPATIVPTTIAPATIAPATIAPVTIAPATVAPVIEAKDQSISTQSADAVLQVCSQSTPVIPGHISEMIYPNIPNNELLKAFNNYWSAQVSHCAICATFASCTSGSSRMMPPDWKYCESTTLPESTPIWVRK